MPTEVQHLTRTPSAIAAADPEVLHGIQNAMALPLDHNLADDLFERLTPAEQQKICQEWEEYDSNLDGEVMKEEFEKAVRDRLSRGSIAGVDESEVDDQTYLFFKQADLDGDKVVLWWEFMESKAFAVLDARKGLGACLTEQELARVKGIFRHLDADHDSKITEHEAQLYYEIIIMAEIKDAHRKAISEWDRSQLAKARAHSLFIFTRSEELGIEEFTELEAKTIITDRYREDNLKLWRDPEKVSDFEVHRECITEHEEQFKVEEVKPLSSEVIIPGDEEIVPVHEPASVLSDERYEHAKIVFADMDEDKDGHLTMGEVRKVLKNLGLPIRHCEFKKYITKAFKLADKNKDSQLNLEEFLPMYQFLYMQRLDYDVFLA